MPLSPDIQTSSLNTSQYIDLDSSQDEYTDESNVNTSPNINNIIEMEDTVSSLPVIVVLSDDD